MGSPSSASTTSSSDAKFTITRFLLRAPISPLIESDDLPVSARDSATFANKLRYAFTEMALESFFKGRLEEFIELVTDASGVSLRITRGSTTPRRGSGSALTPTTAAANQSTGLLYSLTSLHDDFSLMLSTFDIYSLLTNASKIWFKLQNHCFLHKSYMGALICSLYWQQYGPVPTQEILQTPVATALSVPQQLKPLTITAILLREAAALMNLIASRHFSSVVSTGSLTGNLTLQYHLSQTYQQLLIVRDQMNFILMQSYASEASSSPVASSPLLARSKDNIKVEWNLLTTLIHTTLLLWSLEVHDYTSITNILDSSFANSQIKHPKLSVQYTLTHAKVDVTQPVQKQPQHIMRNEIPLSNGHEYKVSFFIVDASSSTTQHRYLCVYYNTYAACAKLIQKLQTSKGDPDIGYTRSGTPLLVGFLDRQTPKEYSPTHPIWNRVLALEVESEAEDHANAEEDFLANPKLLQTKKATTTSGSSKSDDSQQGVKSSFASLIFCIALHRVLSDFQRNLRNTMIMQMEILLSSRRVSEVGGGAMIAEELKKSIYEALLKLNEAFTSQLQSLNAHITTLFSTAIQRLTHSKLEFEYVDLDEAEGPQMPSSSSHPSKAARIYPIEEIMDSCFQSSIDSTIAASQPNSLSALIQSLHLEASLKLLSTEIIRLFAVENVGVSGQQEIPFTSVPVDVYRKAMSSTSSGSGTTKVLAIPQSIVVNPLDSRIIAIATSQGIREINVDHSMKYRRRGKDMNLEDEEENTFLNVLHRFDRMETLAGGQQGASKTMFDAANQLLNSYSSNYALTHTVYPQPKVLLAAILGEVYSYGLPPPTGPSKPVTPPQSYSVGGQTRVYEDFTSASLNEMNMLAKGGVINERDIVATQLTSHPSLPMYVSVSGNRILLWHFGWPAPLAEFSPRPSASIFSRTNLSRSTSNESKPETITRIRFNTTGNKIAATTESGKLMLWVFAYRPFGVSSIPSTSGSSDSPLLPTCESFEVHNKGAADLTWIAGSSAGGVGGNGNIIATAGEASNHM